MPPSTLIGSGQGEWTPKDRLLVVAHHLWEKRLCAGCSGDVLEWDSGVDYDVEEHVCPRCAAREKYAADQKDGIGPGVKLALVRVEADLDDEDLPEHLRRPAD